MGTGRRASQSKQSEQPSKGKIKNRMASATIINDRSFDPSYIAKERAARSELLQNKHKYESGIKVIISAYFNNIFDIY